MRRIDGGEPDADALPNLAETITDPHQAFEVLARAETQLRERYDAAGIEVISGFGAAWTGQSGGSYEVVAVDDVGLGVALGSEATCPTGPDLHTSEQGIPLFFFVTVTRTDPTSCVVSGPRTIEVPSLVGLAHFRAVDQALAVGLQVIGDGVPAGDPTGPDAIVTAHEPPAGARVAEGACVGFRTE